MKATGFWWSIHLPPSLYSLKHRTSPCAHIQKTLSTFLILYTHGKMNDYVCDYSFLNNYQYTVYELSITT